MRAGLDHQRAIEERHHGLLKQQVGLPVGVDGQVGLDQVQVVDPVIDPVALTWGGLEVLLRVSQGRSDQGLRIHLEPQLRFGDGPQQLARGEGLRQHRFQSFRPLDQGQHVRAALRRQGKTAALHHQWIVAVGLDQAQEREHVERAHVRL